LLDSHEPIKTVADAENTEAERHAVSDVSMIDG
jgi:hypothetical protein